MQAYAVNVKGMKRERVEIMTTIAVSDSESIIATIEPPSPKKMIPSYGMPF